MSREQSGRASTSEGRTKLEPSAGPYESGRAVAGASLLPSIRNQTLQAAFSRDSRLRQGSCCGLDKPSNLAVQRRLSSPRVQAKLAVGPSNDEHEREADRVAEQVVDKKTKPCLKCQSEEEPVVRRKTDVPSAPTTLPLPTRNGGRALDATTRGEMEEHLGHDLSGVRIHTGPQADRSARLLNARAYTLGQDVVFRDGGFRPETSAGKSLLAHELTHVVQQSGGATAIQRAPDENAEEVDDDDEELARPARAVSCPGGAMPFDGVCLTDEVLEAIPDSGDVHAAVEIAKARAAEKRAQARVQERFAKLSDAALSKKISEMRASAVARDSVPALLGDWKRNAAAVAPCRSPRPPKWIRRLPCSKKRGVSPKRNSRPIFGARGIWSTS